MMGSVYLITDPNGKQYVGQTIKSINIRWSNIKSGSINALLLANLELFGEDSFIFEVLLESDIQEELWKAERFYISELNTLTPNGYNLAAGSPSCSGWTRPEESCKAISKTMKGMIGHPGTSGETSVNHVLTDQDVFDARKKHLLGVSYKQLAKEYGVGYNTIYNAVTGKSWAHLKEGLS